MPRSVRHRKRRVARTRFARNKNGVDTATLFAMASQRHQHQTVALPLPSKSLRPIKSGKIGLFEIPGKGRGVIATRFIPRGTTIYCEKPLCMVTDAEQDDVFDDDDEEDSDEDEDGEEDDDGNSDTAHLVLKILAKARRNHNYWYESGLRHMFPRNCREAKDLEKWRCSDAFLDAAVRHATRDIRKRKVLGNWKYLPLIVRHNAVDVTTCGEMLSYPVSAYANLAGLALYGPRPSSLNHSRFPNVVRWHVGDVGVWRTNRDVEEGEELCISYCESDLLFEDDPTMRKQAMKHFDFFLFGDEDDLMHNKRLLDTDRQNMFMQEFEPAERLKALNKLGAPELACDKIQLRLLKAISFAQLSKASSARREFLATLRLCQHALPPNDEQTIVVAFHCARAALASGQPEQATKLLRLAYSMHNIIFGGGLSLFAVRFDDDAEMRLGYSPDTDSSTLFELIQEQDEDYEEDDATARSEDDEESSTSSDRSSDDDALYALEGEVDDYDRPQLLYFDKDGDDDDGYDEEDLYIEEEGDSDDGIVSLGEKEDDSSTSGEDDDSSTSSEDEDDGDSSTSDEDGEMLYFSEQEDDEDESPIFFVDESTAKDGESEESSESEDEVMEIVGDDTDDEDDDEEEEEEIEYFLVD